MQKWIGPGLGLVVWVGLKAAGVNSIAAFIAGVFAAVLFGPGLAWILSGDWLLTRSRVKIGRKAIVRACRCHKEAVVYTEMDSLSPSVTKLVPGSEVEPVAVKEKQDVLWVSVKLPDGQQGYILGHNIEQQ